MQILKDMCEDDDASAATDDSITDDEESLVQTGRNIDDDNAETAEMALLEDQSGKDIGENDDASAATDDPVPMMGNPLAKLDKIVMTTTPKLQRWHA